MMRASAPLKPWPLTTSAPATSTDTNYNGFNADDVSLTNTDDETPTIEIDEVDGNSDAPEGGSAQNLNITLGAQPEGNVVIIITDGKAPLPRGT